MRIPTCRIYFVPPSESHEAAPGNVFEIVKIRGEKEDGKDEYHDTIFLGGDPKRWNTAINGRGGEAKFLTSYW